MKLHIFFILLLFTIGNAKAGETDSLWVQRQDTAELSSEQMVINFLQESGIPITYGNKVKLLTSGREKFNDLFEAIRGAKHHIHLEYFNFRNDSIANALFDLLAEKVYFKQVSEVRKGDVKSEHEEITRAYQPGRNINLSISFNL